MATGNEPALAPAAPPSPAGPPPPVYRPPPGIDVEEIIRAHGSLKVYLNATLKRFREVWRNLDEDK